jgi:hypothetical protein
LGSEVLDSAQVKRQAASPCQRLVTDDGSCLKADRGRTWRYIPSNEPPGTCRDVRLTTYTDNNDQLGCGYHRAVATIPQLVRDRMYFAMAEPFYGGSYNGPPGEACGECWELTTATTTAIVIAADLCPVEGNVPCSDPNQLHFDLVTRRRPSAVAPWTSP